VQGVDESKGEHAARGKVRGRWENNELNRSRDPFITSALDCT
jgi:hypothetical protein